MQQTIERSISEIDFEALCSRKFTPSPAAWEDQVLYFLLVDRFSDGNEDNYIDNDGKVVKDGKTKLFTSKDANSALKTEQSEEKWRKAGLNWAGGNLKGLESKIGYIKRLGATAIWVSPVFKQAPFSNSYHGYGIQNFLDIDPHFGTRADLAKMVETAHEHGIYVILDIILNHAGDVFQYDSDRYWVTDASGLQYCDTRWDGNSYDVKGYNDKNGKPTIPFAPVDLKTCPKEWLDGAIWPVEMQMPGTFTCKGHICNWDNDPEYLEGDFYCLKDISLGCGNIDDYQPSDALKALTEIYKYWIAFSDIDGFRIDTVKHMDKGAVRYFASEIRKFANKIGKRNFYLIGEITGGREYAYDTMEATGLSAALGIDEIPDKLEYLVKGWRNPCEYFELFSNYKDVDRDYHIWFRNNVVSVLDDHDQVRKGEYKARFCADYDADRVLLNALALNTTTLGIPCIYYGSEQFFNGSGRDDRYIREAMFGGEFGAFQSRQRHFFNEDSPAYKMLSEILEIRRRKTPLRRGTQFLRPISGDGENFDSPCMLGEQIRSIIPWSRIYEGCEMLCAINTDYYNSNSAWITIDENLHAPGSRMRCIFSTHKDQIGEEVAVEERNGSSVKITVPEAGFVIFE